MAAVTGSPASPLELGPLAQSARKVRSMREALLDDDLWSHQPKAVAAIVEALRDGGRATAESACGSGKSRVAARVAGRLAPAGRVLVTVPTLELVAQMLATFAGHGLVGLGRVVAVCSDAEVLSVGELELGDAAVTTDAARLAALTDVSGRITVLCTYQSLEVLAAAHAEGGMPAWDLAVIDEAHRTAGRAGRAWSIVHDDVMIPAKRRLYMTATRKIFGTSGDDSIVSMDDEKIYGPVVFRFTTAEGIERGLLADYQVLVVVVTDQQVRKLTQAEDQHLRLGGQAVTPHALATQIAVLRAAEQHGIRRAITFHNRVKDAEAWAALLPHAWQMMPAEHRPSAVSAHHVYGGQPLSERRQVLGRLRAPHHHADSQDSGVEVVCNARVLTEGVDAPAVDAVVFVDPKNSVIDTVQGVGRAMRIGDHPDKIAYIIVPVLLSPDDDPASALEGSSYAQVWQVIRALRAHDDRMATRLDAARTRIGRNHLTPGTDPDTVVGDTDQSLAPDREGRFRDWLKVCGVPVPDGFAQAIQLRAVYAAAPSWMEYYGLAKAHYQANGELDLATTYQTSDGIPLGHWLYAQRRHRDRLPADRATLLDEIGMTWDKHLDRAWQSGLAAARSYAAAHDNNLHGIPNTWTHDGVRLSRWLVSRRREHRDGKLSTERKAALDAIDPTWHMSDEEIWNKYYKAARAFYNEHGHLSPDPDHRTGNGLDLARWLDRQRRRARARDSGRAN